MNFSQKFKFSEWPNRAIPPVAAGVYAIWQGDLLIYCGMSGREVEKAIESNKNKYGLITRLNSHAQGRLSGNQFCVYVANRLVIPTLTTNDLTKFATGEYKLDYMTKSYIHYNFEYQYLIVSSSQEAYSIENKARSGLIFKQKPLLNPS